MKTYIADIIPRILRFSQKLDDLTRLTNQHWVSLSDIAETKRVFIFETNGELDIYENGVEVDCGTWKLVDQSLKLKLKSGGYLLKHGFFDENVIALKLDSTDTYAFFVNETKFHDELNTIQDVLNFLENKYFKQKGRSEGMGSTKEQQTINPPEYKVQNITEITSFFGNVTKVYQIQFLDGTNGEIYLKVKNNQVYYKEKTEGTWCTLMHYYESFELCVNALNYFLKTGRRLKDGYIITYS